MGYAELRELQNALSTASDIAFSLGAEPAPHETEPLMEALRRAVAAAGSLGAGAGPTGCPEHPRGPVDPLYGDKEDPLPPGWGKCLLCNDRRRRAGGRRRGGRH
ncbi:MULTISPECIES: hypothetical protein [Streptomyces]|uniref:Uncharacterized protein n=1 Tax=Streptomyces luteosporeus TaxID=173856 RepID=A0ABN3TS39_9ACTN